MNTQWAMTQLEKFIEMTTMSYPHRPGVIDLTGHMVTSANNDDLMREAQVIEQILDRKIQNWRELEADIKANRWMRHRQAAIRALESIKREEEIHQNLGENAPRLSASNLHPWVWDGARSLWQSGHYREAVEGAIKKLNAETQNKVGRRDISETDLFKQVFSKDAASSGKPRLRRMLDDNSRTYDSVQRGAMNLAEGIFAGIRNPLSHESDAELSEDEALEYLAVLSVLARWVDSATVERF